jgi:hypothetical protein
MSATTFWDPRALNNAVRKWERDGLTMASRHLRDAIKARINVQGHPLRRRSKPGEPPRFESKDLMKSWTFTVTVTPAVAESVIYSDLGYSYVLEVGGHATFGFIAPRPYVLRTLLAEESVLAHILTQNLP